MNKFLPLAIVVVIFISLLVFYTAYDKQTKTLVPEKLVSVVLFKDVANSLKELNKVAALAAIGLIAITFILGPLSKIFPKIFSQFLFTRKFIGLSGFVFAFLHALYSVIVIYELDLNKMLFANPKIVGFISAVISLFIFFLMSITSTEKAVKVMGYKNWKTLQTTGYIALFLAILHFIILEIKPGKGFDVRPFGVLFLFIALVALILKILTLFIKVPERKSFQEHVSHSETENNSKKAKN